jgi:hypothetical protein
MEIKLHPEALRHFSEQAEGIRACLGPVPLWPPQRPLTGSYAHLAIKDEIQLGVDTGDAPWVEGRMDPLLGRYVTLEIHSPRFGRALSAKGVQAFNRLVDQVSRHRDVSPWCGLKYVENRLIRWLQDAQAGEVPPWGNALVGEPTGRSGPGGLCLHGQRVGSRDRALLLQSEVLRSKNREIPVGRSRARTRGAQLVRVCG